MLLVLLALLVCGGLYRNDLFVLGNWVLGVFVVGFMVIAHYHNGLESRLSRLTLWQHIKLTHVARAQLNWANLPDSQLSVPDHHPYAQDLDLVGSHSLLRILDTTLSTEGQARLVSWFFEQGAQTETRRDWGARQALVRELSTLNGFRDRLQLVAKLLSPQRIDGTRIRRLLAQPIGGRHFPILVLVAGGLALANLGLFFFWVISGGTGYWVLSWLLYVLMILLVTGRVGHLFEHVLDLHMELEKLGSVVSLLETRTRSSLPNFSRVCHPLHLEPAKPSRAISRLGRVCHGLSVKAHPLIHLGLNAMVPWDLVWAYQLSRQTERLGPVLPVWLDCLSMADAACALSTFASLHPEYAWPELIPSEGPAGRAHLEATALGHPLIPGPQRVPNDFQMTGLGQIRLVTGSNMSGKSTFLRTIGLNVCLAQAGGPVCAKSFEWSWCQPYTCIRVGDSLEEGLSFFYAEVKRLKRLLDCTGTRDGLPVLFLIDEIFKGTNNRERLLGSQAFIRELTHRHGFGLVTTHDLELAHLEHDLEGLVNVHFQETIGDRTLQFDYLLKPGPCPTTNALRIMEMEGLPVPQNPLGSGSPNPC